MIGTGLQRTARVSDERGAQPAPVLDHIRQHTVVINLAVISH
jgi:hypothetical protein